MVTEMTANGKTSREYLREAETHLPEIRRSLAEALPLARKVLREAKVSEKTLRILRGES
jgi:hypothetical protein